MQYFARVSRRQPARQLVSDVEELAARKEADPPQRETLVPRR